MSIECLVLLSRSLLIALLNEILILIVRKISQLCTQIKFIILSRLSLCPQVDAAAFLLSFANVHT
jgi:hypothetical protein